MTIKVLALCVGISLASVGTARAANSNEFLNQWVQNQFELSKQKMIKNISPAGTIDGVVVASPVDHSPNYFFHWVRDAALVMNEVIELEKASSSALMKKQYRNLIENYIKLERRFQLTPNRSKGFGEPKFNVDGTAFNGDWGRPQNDGPALRALTLIRYSNLLLDEGQDSFVKSHLYDGYLPTQTVVKADLEYTSHHWKETNFDPWEEVRGYHFYNQMVQHKALFEGAKLAIRLNDFKAADWYFKQAQELVNQIQMHWDQNKHILVATTLRDDGVPYKYSGLDISVVLGVLHTDLTEVENIIFPIQDSKVISTVEQLRKTFSSLYPINGRGYPGVVMGRYPEDRYDGIGFSGGNGWVLSSNAMAEFSFRLASRIKYMGQIKIDSNNLQFFSRILIQAGVNAPIFVDDVISSNQVLFDNLLTALRDDGDSYLKRLQIHLPADGSLSEQINRYSGFMQGAPDLTWSYASYLSAYRSR